MPDRREQLDRVETLAFRMFEAGLTQPEGAELDALLREVDGAAEAYVRYADVHAMLSFSHGEVKADSPEDLDREVFNEILQLALQERERSEVQARAQAMLRTQQESMLDELRAQSGRAEQRSGKRVLVIPTWMIYVGGLSAAALLALAIYPFWGGLQSSGSGESAGQASSEVPVPPVVAENQPEEQSQQRVRVVAAPSATVARSFGAVWDGRRTIGVGASLDDRPMRLTEGFVELAFTSGVTVIVQAPAELRVASDFELELDRGLLKATVPPGAEGFTVVTPAGRVVDLGTEFGVEVLSEDRTSVDVMKGRVRAELPQSLVSAELVAGQGTRLTTQATRIVTEQGKPQRYPERWSLVQTGVKTLDSGVRLYSPPRSVEVGRFENDNRIVVFAERRGVTLAEDLAVSIVDPDFYDRMPKADDQRIAAGTAVDSYMLHFDATGQPAEVVETTATFVFDQPILGVIVSSPGLARTDGLLGLSSIVYPAANTPTRGLEGRGHSGKEQELDVIQLAGDRKTLTIRMGTTNLVDQIRVIVAADPGPAERP